MYTFRAYYIDVFDYDRQAGRVGSNLPSSYFPTYMTDNDTNAYDTFFRSTYGKKWLNFTFSSYDLAQGLDTLSETIRNISIEDLKKKVSSITDVINRLEMVHHTKNLAKNIQSSFTDQQELMQIHSPEGMMKFIAEKISANDEIEEASKEFIKSIYNDVLSQVFLTIGNATPAGLLAITTMYETSMLPWYLTIYDQAAINTLPYTRGTRLSLRQYQSWGM